MKVVSRKKYKNIHNGIITSVIGKIFFNIQHIRDGDNQSTYTHYKKFLKNWKRCDDLKCRCGADIKYDVGDDILFYVAEQRYVVLCDDCRKRN